MILSKIKPCVFWIYQNLYVRKLEFSPWPWPLNFTSLILISAELSTKVFVASFTYNTRILIYWNREALILQWRGKNAHFTNVFSHFPTSSGTLVCKRWLQHKLNVIDGEVATEVNYKCDHSCQGRMSLLWIWLKICCFYTLANFIQWCDWLMPL